MGMNANFHCNGEELEFKVRTQFLSIMGNYTLLNLAVGMNEISIFPSFGQLKMIHAELGRYITECEEKGTFKKAGDE